AQPTQPTQPAKVETEPTKPPPPADVIKRLTIEKDKEHPYSARLTWEVDPANDTEIYVARFVRPPATRQLILESENLTTPPLGPKETTFLDRNMPEGSYYYAIVTGYQMSKKGTLSLKADENYTTRPFIIQRGHPPEDTKIQTPPTNPIQPVTQGPQVQGLSAVSAESSVKLNWTAPAASRVVFNVYRGTGAFVDPDSFAAAKRLGSVGEDRMNFEDTSPVTGQQVYYAVTMQEKDTGREYRNLTAGVSYIPFTYRKPQVEANYESVLPRSFVTYLSNRNTIKLMWVEPLGAVAGYQVFRSNRPISTVAELDRAYLIGRAGSKDTSFTDAGVMPGVHFYAILSLDTEGRPVKILAEGRNFSGFGVMIREGAPEKVETKPDTKPDIKPDTKPDTKVDTKPDTKVEPVKVETKTPALTLFRGSVRENNVQLTWSADNVERGDRFLIYRSNDSMTTISDVRASGLLLSEQDWDSRAFLDSNLKPAKYYYAILLLHQGRVGDRMEEGRNYLPLPAQIRSTEPEKIDKPEVKPDTKPEKVDTKPEKVDTKPEVHKIEPAAGDSDINA
ncbi:MAG TPA: hypothetical protein PLW55_14140, partial [Leptospiraceae bacterium]|nr:hypothetical protein [Leptospiraceae bacterium]